MVRTLLTALVALFATAAAAQHVVLVHRPPTYENGEVPPSAGVLVTKEGIEMSLHEQAQSASDGNMYLVMTLSDRQGAVFGSVFLDPRTLRGGLQSKEENIAVKSTTCAPERVYPIYQGKVLECVDELVVNGSRMLTNRSRSEFDQVMRDPSGRISGYCMRVNADDGELLMKARVCFSADGKWVRSVRIISTEKRKDI